ncbi:MAG: hypothetical protein ACHQD7_02220 [Chitinophagales bacterium]
MRLTFCITTVIGLMFLSGVAAAPRPGELKIGQLELGYPSPAIPFYHFRAQLQLPNPSVIEVEVAVNGKVLRFTDLERETEVEDSNRPSITHRPPSGAGLSQDNTVYTDPFVTGWVKWQPGARYEIRITVRMKKGIQNANDDVLLSTSKTITAPADVKVFDTAWKSYKAVVVSETAGIDRKGEPVKVLLPFYPDEVNDLKREVRVVAVDSRTHVLTEVPSQVYDVQKYAKEDDLSPDKNGKPTRQVPIWLPTVTAQLAFLADVPARTSRVYLIYYNNEAAVAKMYSTDLHVQGEAPGLQIDNEMFTASLNPNSGHLDQITLKTKPDVPLFHHMETNGAIHWNPEIYTPPLPWTHTSDWNPPDHIKSIIGPVITFSDVYGHLKEIPEVDASVRYEFYPGKPYFISATSLRINETVQCLALRNAEIVFKRELFSHAAWYDVIRDSVVVYNVADMADLMDIKMEADIPWISFFDEKTGIGFAGIQLSYANAGLESAPRLLNPYFYITAGPWIYWARALSLSFLASNMQQMIPAMKGNFFSEKWAYLVYETDKGDKPYSPVITWMKKLTHPLRVELSEEVDDRVSRTVTELFVDKGKSGWENRETSTHHSKK